MTFEEFAQFITKRLERQSILIKTIEEEIIFEFRMVEENIRQESAKRRAALLEERVEV